MKTYVAKYHYDNGASYTKSLTEQSIKVYLEMEKQGRIVFDYIQDTSKRQVPIRYAW